MSSDDLYRAEVKSSIYRSIGSGATSFTDIQRCLGSPDPRLLKQLYDEVMTEFPPTAIVDDRDQLRTGSTRARRLTSALPLSLPAADPVRCQWWFGLDSIATLATLAWQLHANGSVAFLGAPTVGYFYANWINEPVSLLDADMDVLDSLKVPTSAKKVCYDVADPVPHEFTGKHSVVVMDPPWYPDAYRFFIARGRELLGDKGYLVCALPSRLTRPGVIEERTQLLAELLESKFEVVSVETERVRYVVPDFEARAYEDLPGFANRQWRRGDLLVLRASQETNFPPPQVHPVKIEAFSRNPRQLRFFLDPSKVAVEQTEMIKPIPEFQRGVSARLAPTEHLSVWGTNKRAAQLRDSEPCRSILESWALGKTLEETCRDLVDRTSDRSADAVTALNETLQLWPSTAEPCRRRSTDRLVEFRRTLLSELAAEPSRRHYPHEEDGFRLGFQRDRDRILWSQSLKRLANKTQLFPVKTDDQLRRRLSHSIEVMQLSATIAYAFGLDKDLTEAGALAHDIGHTPFGHAGEHALNMILDEIDVRFGGFNHYEHGLDVVRWLETPYRSPGAGEFPGLNLTVETEECILKHTYHRDDHEIGQTRLVEKSKHKDIIDDSCHLEGQAIRVADKISYLISDIEDGIRMEAFGYDELMSCRFFERPPIDLQPAASESLLSRFISQRRAILKVIMEDVLSSTDDRLSSLPDLNAVRSERKYVVDFCAPLKDELIEIWATLQKGILHVHPAVVAENMRAARIVRDLLVTYAIAPALIEPHFLDAHEGLQNTEYAEWYKASVGEYIGLPQRLLSRYAYEHAITSRLKKQGDNWLIPVKDLVVAKDYVASLTDVRAIAEHRLHCAEVM